MGTSATKAKNKYAQKNYDQIRLQVKKGLKEEYQEKARIAGYKSLNSFIVDAIEEKIEKL